MEIIYNSCKNSSRIYCSTINVDDIKKLSMRINPKKDEILMSRFTKNNDCIFNFKLGVNTTIGQQIEFMKTIEMFYKDTFTWRFDGQHIEMLGLVVNKKENLGKLSRYKGFDNFIKYLRNRVVEILKFRDMFAHTPKMIDDKIIVTGSINNKTNMYAVPILPTHDKYDVLGMANKRIIGDINIKELDLGFWIKEINPDFYKTQPKRSGKKYPITPEVMRKYPNCIKEIACMKKKGNYNRFLLSTFLLAVHNERDAKHQLDILLNDEEREHINTGNCKDQWRTILAKEYPAPSCKTMLECGHCKHDCGRAAPAILEERGY